MVNRGETALPFAELAERIAKRLGAKARTVRLAAKDAAWQGGIDYKLAARVIAEGEATAEGVVEAAIGGETVSVTLRTDDDGSVYLEGVARGE